MTSFGNVELKTITQFNLNKDRPFNWSSGNSFVSGVGSLKFKSRTGQKIIDNEVSLMLQHLFERSWVARAQ